MTWSWIVELLKDKRVVICGNIRKVVLEEVVLFSQFRWKKTLRRRAYAQRLCNSITYIPSTSYACVSCLIGTGTSHREPSTATTPYHQQQIEQEQKNNCKNPLPSAWTTTNTSPPPMQKEQQRQQQQQLDVSAVAETTTKSTCRRRWRFDYQHVEKDNTCLFARHLVIPLKCSVYGPPTAASPDGKLQLIVTYVIWNKDSSRRRQKQTKQTNKHCCVEYLCPLNIPPWFNGKELPDRKSVV